MVFDHSANIDLRGGIITSIDRDQINTTVVSNHIQISFSLFGSQTHHLPYNFRGGPPRLTSDCSTSSEEWRLIPPQQRSHDIVSIINITAGLIVQITHLLHDRREASNNHRDLVHELKALHQTLVVTGLAIQEYESRPLGQSLANTITPKVEQSYITLQELLDRANGTWQGLNLTSISNLWCLVWWGRWDGDELSSLRRNLCDNRRSLEAFLVALHSYVMVFC